jgi:hypothetical protein
LQGNLKSWGYPLQEQVNHFLKGRIIRAAELREMKPCHFRITAKNGDPEICSAKISGENQGWGVRHDDS